MKLSDEDILSDDNDFTNEQFEEAVDYVEGALEAVAGLEELCSKASSISDLEIVQKAAEGIAIQFSVPEVAMEAEGSGATAKMTKVEKVIAYLKASAKKVIQWLIQWMLSRRHSVRDIHRKSVTYLNKAETIPDSVKKGSIDDTVLRVGLSIDGVPPRRPALMFQDLANDYGKFSKTSCYPELVNLLDAAKAGDRDAYTKRLAELHKALLTAAKSTLQKVEVTTSHPAFKKKEEGIAYFSSPVNFGQYYFTVAISEEVPKSGAMHYRAAAIRDPEVPLRTTALPALNPSEVRAVCKTVRRLAEMILQDSSHEDKMLKLVRDVDFVKATNDNDVAVDAMRSFSAVVNNQYFSYLRRVVIDMRLLMRYCALSMANYS